MYALITGASSGIGKEIAYLLAAKGYDLILVARRNDRLVALKEEIKGLYNKDSIVKCVDLEDTNAINTLFNETKDLPIDVLINNAGFGEVNFFDESENDFKMINLNVLSMHLLLKLYYHLFNENKQGYILNVASMAAFMPGPKMATYYATKAYVLSLTKAVAYEAKRKKNNVNISALCPGPVKTEFNDVAHVRFGSPSITAKRCAKIAIKGLFKKKMVIVPGFMYKMGSILSKFVSTHFLLHFSYNVQEQKTK